MSSTDNFLANNARYADSFEKGDLPIPPANGARRSSPAWTPASKPGVCWGSKEGDAHVIRNAGGVVTDDVLRSLVISQRLLGTEEIVLIHHTDCGMVTFKDDDVKDADRKPTPASGPASPSKRSPMSRRTCVKASAAFRRIRSSP